MIDTFGRSLNRKEANAEFDRIVGGRFATNMFGLAGTIVDYAAASAGFRALRAGTKRHAVSDNLSDAGYPRQPLGKL